jgi:SAM-dependent methyltransferase
MAGMAEGQAARTYLMEANEAEHARLIALARRQADQVREMCARAGVGAGARVIDVGCGPVGALLELADIAGPRGTVVGLDSSPEAVAAARALLAGRGLGRLRVVHGDINSMEPSVATTDGPFDAAHLRFVLVHQADPAATLRRVAALLRPGGRVLVADLVEDTRYPRYDPPVPASERAWALLYAAAQRRGAAADVARRVPGLCAEAGLRVLDARGVFRLLTLAQELLGTTRATLLSARRSIVGPGLATDTEVDALADELAAAGGQAFRSTHGPLGVQVIAEVP